MSFRSTPGASIDSAASIEASPPRAHRDSMYRADARSVTGWPSMVVGYSASSVGSGVRTRDPGGLSGGYWGMPAHGPEAGTNGDAGKTLDVQPTNSAATTPTNSKRIERSLGIKATW